MLLRYDNGKLYLLESTNGEGVGISVWNDASMGEYKDFYQRVVYRQLKFKRTAEAITKLQEFLTVPHNDNTLESKRKEVQT